MHHFIQLLLHFVLVIIISNYHILIMLIHTGSVAYPTATHYGSGTGLIFLSSIDCLGIETSLLKCTYSPFHSCSHTFDVGVKCEGMAVLCTVSIDARHNTLYNIMKIFLAKYNIIITY